MRSLYLSDGKKKRGDVYKWTEEVQKNNRDFNIKVVQFR